MKDFDKIDQIMQVNKMFEHFVHLYMFLGDINIYFSNAEKDDIAAFADFENPMYAEYCASRNVQGYALVNCFAEMHCFEGFTNYPAQYEHVIKLSGSGAIHEAYRTIAENSCLNDVSGEIILRCRFLIDEDVNVASYWNLQEVQVHGISNFHLINNFHAFSEATKKQADVLEFGCNYFLNPKFHLSYQTREHGSCAILEEIDAISNIATERMLQMSTLGNAADILLRAAGKRLS